MSERRTRLVYSTDPATPRAEPEPRPEASLPPERHALRVRRERAGRGGKTVTVAGPFALAVEDAERLLAELKRACGAGGTLRRVEPAGATPQLELELQGDQVQRLHAALAERGYPVR